MPQSAIGLAPRRCSCRRPPHPRLRNPDQLRRPCFRWCHDQPRTVGGCCLAVLRWDHKPALGSWAPPASPWWKTVPSGQSIAGSLASRLRPWAGCCLCKPPVRQNYCRTRPIKIRAGRLLNRPRRESRSIECPVSADFVEEVDGARILPRLAAIGCCGSSRDWTHGWSPAVR